MRIISVLFALTKITAEKAVITTWAFPDATTAAWDIVAADGSVLDAITYGTAKCEELQCDGTVGWGHKPDEIGEVTLDAMIMDGQTGNVGAVGGLRRVKNAAGVARRVLDHTTHSLIVGSSATEFAIQLGFAQEPLEDDETRVEHEQWKANQCQPNFWVNMMPDPAENCGPYTFGEVNDTSRKEGVQIDNTNHDTIGMVVVDDKRQMAAGTTTNGLRNKIPGRVGDSPIPGAGYMPMNMAGRRQLGRVM